MENLILTNSRRKPNSFIRSKRERRRSRKGGESSSRSEKRDLKTASSRRNWERQWKNQVQEREWVSEQHDNSVYSSPQDDDTWVSVLLVGIPQRTVLRWNTIYTINDLVRAKNEEGPSYFEEWLDNLLVGLLCDIFPGTTGGTRLFSIVSTLQVTMENKANGETVFMRTSLGILNFSGRNLLLEVDFSKLHYHPTRWDGTNFDHVDIFPVGPHGGLQVAGAFRENRDNSGILIRFLGRLRDFVPCNAANKNDIILSIVLCTKRHPQDDILQNSASEALCCLATDKESIDLIHKYGGVLILTHGALNGFGGEGLRIHLLGVFCNEWDPCKTSLSARKAVSRLVLYCMEDHPCTMSIQELGISTFTKIRRTGPVGEEAGFFCERSVKAVFSALNHFGGNVTLQWDGCELLCSDILRHKTRITGVQYTLPSDEKCLPTLLFRPVPQKACIDGNLSILGCCRRLKSVSCIALRNLYTLTTKHPECVTWLAENWKLIPLLCAMVTLRPGRKEFQQYACSLLEKLLPFIVHEGAKLGSTVHMTMPTLTALVAAMKHEDSAELAYTSLSVLAKLHGVKVLMLAQINEIVSIIWPRAVADGLSNVRSLHAAIKLLCQLDLQASDTQIELMQTHNICSIMSIMKCFPLDTTIQRYGCKILRCFVRSRHCAHRDQGIFTLSRCDAKGLAKAAMANHPNNKRIVYSSVEIVLRIRDFERDEHRLSRSFSGID